MNVALGGSLIQDIPDSHARSRHAAERVHAVDIDAGSRLAAIVGEARITVNSSHHQAIRRVAAALRDAGKSPDGIIEVIEAVDPAWWMVGVQWHPETLVATEQAWDRRIFAAFAEQVHRFQSALRAT